MRVLLVGAMDGQIGAASKIALDQGAEVIHAPDRQAALDILRQGKGVEALMVDVRQDIAALIQSMEAERITVPVVACGVAADAQAAVRAIKAGAKEYVPLPPDTDLIAAVLLAITEDSHALVHGDPATAQVLKLADQIAPSDASVLITGESGTGKEVIARYIHRNSKRKTKRFVAVNCAAIPESLLESELFGHEKGAFTGAVARRLGKFEEANGGTLLLDEISEMDARLQAKLLRAIQEREIDRLGGKHTVKVDVRILATTNRALQKEVRKGTFREDLYFRLNVVTMAMPALRDRPGDLAPLSEHFLKHYAEANGIPYRPLTEAALAKMKAYHWPGNVRELENTMHRAVLLGGGTATEADAIMLTEALDQAAPSATNAQVGQTLAEAERSLIIDTLQHTVGDRSKAAEILGISIRTLRAKLHQYEDEGIAVPAG